MCCSQMAPAPPLVLIVLAEGLYVRLFAAGIPRSAALHAAHALGQVDGIGLTTLSSIDFSAYRAIALHKFSVFLEIE